MMASPPPLPEGDSWTPRPGLGPLGSVTAWLQSARNSLPCLAKRFAATAPIKRYAILLLSCILVMGPYNAYDSVGSVQTDLQRDLGVSDVQFSYLFSVYSLPNVPLVFAGGLLLDAIGVRAGTLLFAALVALGSGLVVLATHARSYPLMLLGRFVFGTGAESLFVAQNSIIASWFAAHRSEMGLAMACPAPPRPAPPRLAPPCRPADSVQGLGTSAGRLGTFLAYRATAYLLHRFKTYVASLWLAAGMCALSLVSAVGYVLVDKHLWRPDPAPSDFAAQTVPNPAGGHAGPLAAVRSLPLGFWLVTAAAAAYYGTVFPFQAFSGKLLQLRYGLDLEHADELTSVVALSSLLLSPPLGMLVDRIGRRADLVAAGTLALVPAFLAIYAARCSPLPFYCLIGACFALVPAALWPSLPILVPPEHVGSAFGIASAGVNLALMASYAAAASLGPPGNLFYFAGLAALGGLVAVAWSHVDFSMGSKCNNPG
eukprot:tig00000829_g4681.t1